MFWIDYWYIVLVLPAMILGLIAQVKVKSTFEKYSTVYSRRGYTGADIARRILDKNGLYDVRVERIAGHLTDHFDPRENVVRLSESVYDSSSVASIGVAAHEVGHAIQYAKNYAPMKVRSAIIPVTRFGSTVAPLLIMLGFFAWIEPLIIVGVALYSTIAVFQLVTLPVEFNASRRALATLDREGILDRESELSGAKRVLSAAAMTYVTALIMSLAYILRFLLLFAGRRRD
ncbi:MAG: zinc metallopeptidase [Clostridia bacterium]|nr:zinc metallopeptidase [Clostridia bacterium]